MFKNRLVRDLSWVISSPSLISGTFKKVKWWDDKQCLSEFHACLPALKELDNNPSPLVSHIAALKTKGLGHRFEALVYFWLKISPNYNLLANNIQIIIEGQTYGEIDFIIEEVQSKHIIHLEVAVKFYLGSAPYNDPYRWFGTNLSDQLGKKVEHLKIKQTQLSLRHETFLKRMGYTIDERHCFLKGRLFYPISSNCSAEGTNKNHLRGRWAKDNTNDSNQLYFALKKENWLANLKHDDIEESFLITKPKVSKWPICYAQMRKDSSGNLSEVNRLFHLPSTFEFPKN